MFCMMSLNCKVGRHFRPAHFALPIRQRDALSLDLEVLGRRFSTIGDDLVLDVLALVEGTEAGPLHRRDVNKHILPTALRLDEPIAFSRIEPLHRSGRHNLLQSFEQNEPVGPPKANGSVTEAADSCRTVHQHTDPSSWLKPATRTTLPFSDDPRNRHWYRSGSC